MSCNCKNTHLQVSAKGRHFEIVLLVLFLLKCHHSCHNFFSSNLSVFNHIFQIQSPDAQGVRPEQQAKSRKFYKVATSFEVIQYACFLLDVLQQLNNLSLTLQRKTITIAEVAKSLQVTRAVIEKYKDR